MASHRSHFSVSALLGIGYAAAGVVVLNTHPEYALLAAVIVLVSGLLPNIDNGPATAPAQEFIGFIAALAPLVAIEQFPEARHGGVARIALVVICSYLLAKIIFSRVLTKWTANRGMLHSIPAAVICSEIVYLLFWDLLPRDRLFVSAAALVGYGAHLFLDASSNFELLGTPNKKPAVMKIAAPNWFATTMMYSTMIVLGWFVASDLYPGLKVSLGVHY